MTIKEIENFWTEAAIDALDTSKTLFKGKKFNHSMFFLHLAIEKIIKALFTNRNMTEPPIGHNLQTIAFRINDISFSDEQIKLLTQISAFNIASRYDDYKNEFRKICDIEFAKKYLTLGEEIFLWIKSQIK